MDSTAGYEEVDDLDAYIQGLSDPEYVDFIADFLKPTPLEMCFVVIFLVLMVVGVIGNCMVVYVVITNRHMVSPSTLPIPLSSHPFFGYS